VAIDHADPDFTLRWPPHLLVEELTKLVAQARQGSVDGDWDEEVRTLLSQAFADETPLSEFSRRQDAPVNAPWLYDNEEPF
jgi:hypothetical protein